MSRVPRVLLTLVLGLALVLSPGVARAELVDIPYTVVRGDTGRRIARRFGLTYAELVALNEGHSLERLRVGESIVVGRGHRHVHRVHAGESLSDIAGRYRVSLAELQRWNVGLRPARLARGQEIVLYSDREEPPSESVGEVDDGSLVNGIALPPHPGYVVRHRERTFLTLEAADRLLHAFDRLRDEDEDAPRVQIGDASRARGGPLDQHRSHQSGRDVDIDYFYRRCRETCGHHRLTADQLDADRQWRLIEPWLREGAVEYIFIDHALQEPLYEAARRAGASRNDLSRWFQWPRAIDVRVGVIRHVPSHADHMHVRFTCAPHDTGCVPSDGRDPRHE
ncbi:MAG: penicillin-insensitive murein endopeptidase [Sandaracinus sp.]